MESPHLPRAQPHRANDLEINRAIATRYDKLARSLLDALHLATIRKSLRQATL
jgi:hypothetical protein